MTDNAKPKALLEGVHDDAHWSLLPGEREYEWTDENLKEAHEWAVNAGITLKEHVWQEPFSNRSYNRMCQCLVKTRENLIRADAERKIGKAKVTSMNLQLLFAATVSWLERQLPGNGESDDD